jgi:uracil-DNA glycosylase family 4
MHYPPTFYACGLCPRLAAYRENVALEKRRAYKHESYWGKPVPGFGDSDARMLILGLAPGAHGSNRTGRMFTGDASGDFLYPALHRAGFANQALSKHRHDGLELSDVWITAAARCVPPGNKPTPNEVANCRTWLERDFSQLKNLKLVLALGQIAHNAYLDMLKAQGLALTKSQYPFEHGKLHTIPGALPLLDSYHVSFQNTNTGKLTPDMFDQILQTAKLLSRK